MAERLRFVVQEHHARRLHWDFRLERDGVLVSWAIPKGLPPDPKVNHLAVHVDDHDVEYGSFSGTIPAGRYGAGTVTIWDQGYYETEKWTEREVKVVLHGERIQGRFVLFRTKPPNWMIHRMDEPEHPGWQAVPHDLEPMRPTSGRLPANGADWAYEMSWTGLRVLIAVEGGRLQVTSGSDSDLIRVFPELSALGRWLGTTQVLLDGVLVVFDEQGRPDSELLQARLKAPNPSAIRRLAARSAATFLAVDLLHREGHTLVNASYVDRRAALDELAIALAVAQIPPSFAGASTAALEASRAHGISGIIAKRLGSTYQAGQESADWIRISADDGD